MARALKACFLGLAVCAWAQAQVILVKDSTQAASIPLVRVALEQLHTAPMPPSAHPIVPQLQSEAFELFSLLATDDEKNETIYLVLARGGSVNAAFIRLDNSTKLVLINMGLVDFLDDDHQGSFVLGHELEHGWSQLQDVIDSAARNALASRLLQRAVENEVDLKSVFKRMIPIGADPYAAESFIRKLRIHFPDNGLSESHTLSSSREDTLALANTAARRELGMEEFDLEKIPTLPTRLIDIVKRGSFFEKAYERILVESLESEFSQIQAEVHTFTVNLDAQRAQQDGGHHEFEPAEKGAKTFEQERWDAFIAPELPGATSLENYQRLRGAHIRAVAAAFLKEWESYEKAHTATPSHREMARLMRFLGIPDLERDLVFLEADITRAKEYQTSMESYLGNPEEDQESLGKMIQEAKEQVQVAEQALELGKWRQSIWNESAKGFKRARAKLMASFPERCTMDVCAPKDFDTLIGSEYEAQLWEAANAFADSFHGHPDQWNDEEIFWQILYKVDPAKAVLVWERLLRNAVTGLKENDSDEQDHRYYGKGLLDHILGIRKRCGNFADYPEYRASLERILSVEVVHYLEKGLDKVQAGTHFSSEPEYALTALKLGIKEFSKTYEQAGTYLKHGVLSEETCRGFRANVLKRLRNYIAAAVPALPDTERLAMYPNTLAALAAFAYPVETRDSLLTELDINPKALLTFLGSVARLAEHSRNDTDVVASILRDADVLNFYALLRLLDPSSEQERHTFYHFLYVFKNSMTWNRPSEPGLPLLDADLSFWTGYFDWLLAHHPNAKELIASLFETPEPPNSWGYPSDTDPDEIERLRKEMDAFRDAWRRIDKTPLEERVASYVATEIQRRYTETGDLEASIDLALDEYNKFTEKNIATIIEHFPAALRAHALALLAEKLSYYGHDDVDSQIFAALSTALAQPRISQADWGYLGNVFMQLAKKGKIRNLSRDEAFDSIWQNSSPEQRSAIATPEVAAFLLTHERKRCVIQWVFERDVQPAKVAKASSLTEIRPQIVKAHDLLERFLPKVSDLRDALVDEMAEDLETNPAETDYLFKLCTSTDNWFENEGLALLDLPQHARNLLNRNSEKMLLLQYLTATISLEAYLAGMGDRIGFAKGQFREMARGMQVRFREASIVIRTYILMALIDDLEGLLATAEYEEKVYALLLGSYANNKIARAAFEAYFGALPSGEKRVLIARILSGMIDSDGSGEGFVRRIVDGLKSLGYKGAQFLRAAGIVPKSMEAEFDGVFDRALKPRRDRAIHRLREGFGEDLEGVMYVGGLLGYGSINFVLGVDFEDSENSNAPIEAAVRTMHENVAGQIRNESQVMKRAIETLLASSDHEIRTFGVYMQDSLSASMETLGEGGSEVDLEKDRDLIQRAAAVYQREPDQTHSGYRITVVPTLKTLQDKVAADMQKQMSIHPRITHRRMDQHENGRALSQDAVELELEAAFVQGTFDRDGHPGNWMVDDLNRILYRTDVSQFQDLHMAAPDQREALQILIKPFLNKQDKDRFVDLSCQIFYCGPHSDSILKQRLRRILDSYGTPFSNPIKNLYFYRRKLSEASGLGIPLRFRNETVSYIQTLARNRIHQETTGGFRFYHALSTAAGNTPVQATLQYPLHGLKLCIRAIAGEAE